MQLITAALWLNKGYNSIESLGGEYVHMPTHLNFGRLLCQIQHTQFSKSNIFVGGDIFTISQVPVPKLKPVFARRPPEVNGFS